MQKAKRAGVLSARGNSSSLASAGQSLKEISKKFKSVQQQALQIQKRQKLKNLKRSKEIVYDLEENEIDLGGAGVTSKESDDGADNEDIELLFGSQTEDNVDVGEGSDGDPRSMMPLGDNSHDSEFLMRLKRFENGEEMNPNDLQSYVEIIQSSATSLKSREEHLAWLKHKQEMELQRQLLKRRYENRQSTDELIHSLLSIDILDQFADTKPSDFKS